MKIAMIGQKGVPATYGGVERHVEELSAQLAARGHEVTAYARRHYTKNVTEYRGIHVRILPSIPTKHLDALTHTALCVADALRCAYDVIHFHSIGPASLSFVPRMLKGRSTAVVATIHARDWQRRKWNVLAQWCLRRGESAALRWPHRTIAVSRQMAEHFRERGYDVAHIPNGVAAPTPVPIQELAQWGLEKEKYILWMGRFVPEKRVEDLIAAFRELPGDMKLLLAGEFDERDTYCHSLKEAAGSDRRVIFSGGLYGRAKAEALGNARVFVLPSELEGFPIVLLEAMRYGRPALASDLPENLEAFDPGVSGFAFRVGDVASLRDKLSWMLAHPDEATSAGQKAETNSARFDWSLIAGQTETVYREALGRVHRQ